MKNLTLKLGILLLSLVWANHADAQTPSSFNRYGPVAGIQKNTGSTPYNTAAVAADIYGLWSGTCSSTTFLNGVGACAVPPGTGISFSAPAIFTVTGSPGTSISIAFASGQAANQILATPDGTTGAAGLRALVAGDLPPINLGSTANGGVSSSSILLGTNGGTSNGFMSFTGPTTSLKTFTLPNASATILTTNALVTVSQGGTGAGTLTGLLKGNGTSAFTAAAASDAIALFSGTCNSTTFLRGDGACATAGGGGTPGGSSTQMQYNNGGAFGGTSGLTWDSTNNLLMSSQTSPKIVLGASGAASDTKNWIFGVGSTGDYRVATATDAAPQTVVKNAIDISRTGTAVTTVALGNASDNPTVTINGLSASASFNCTTACSAAGLQVGQSVIVSKGSATTRTSNTTASNDPDLQITNVPAGIYIYKAQIYFSQQSGGGMQIGPVFSGTLVGGGSGFQQNGLAFQNGSSCSPTAIQSVAVSTGPTLSCSSGTSQNTVYIPNGTMDASTSGTFAISWAQNTSSGLGTTLDVPSYIILTRIQ